MRQNSDKVRAFYENLSFKIFCSPSLFLQYDLVHCVNDKTRDLLMILLISSSND